MKERIDPSPRLRLLAHAQSGVLTREQALVHGLGDESIARLVRHRSWQRLGRGVYFTDSGEAPWLALAWSGVLLGGNRARLAGEAAGHLHGLVRAAPKVITVQVPHSAPRMARGPWQFVQERAGIRHCSYGQPPRLDAVDTILDLCEVADQSRVIDLVTAAVQSRAATADMLLRRLADRPRHRQRKLLVAVLTDVRDGVESPLEFRYLHDVERRHRLPRGTRQHKSRGSVRDVWYGEFASVVELDGQVGHVGSGRHRDMRRDNLSTLAGEATLRYGWWDVIERPCLVAAEVAFLLARGGWSGQLVPCERCPGSSFTSSDGVFR